MIQEARRAAESVRPLLTFISYSHAQPRHLTRLRKHLVQLEREGLLRVWDDQELRVGQALDPAIHMRLAQTDVFILLVTQDFIASGYCFHVEMRAALQRHQEGSALVMPIIVSPCDWQRLDIGKLVVAPRDGKPISCWNPRDAGWSDVAKRIRAAALEFDSVEAGVGRLGFAQESIRADDQAGNSTAHESESPVRIELEFKKKRDSRGQHEYVMEATITNRSNRRLDDWDLELTVPTPVVWPALTVKSPGLVRSDEQYSVIRRSARDGKRLYPGDHDGIELHYRMNRDLYAVRQHLYKQRVALKAFVDGRPVEQIDEVFEEFQDY